MAKNLPLGIRLEPDERDALEKAAASEVLSMSALGRKIMVEWLRKYGWLDAAEAAPRKPSTNSNPRTPKSARRQGGK